MEEWNDYYGIGDGEMNFSSTPIKRDSKIAYYQKKPIIVKAFQYQGYDKEIPKWFKDALDEERVTVNQKTKDVYISTLEGVMTAHLGDYIIMGIKGELYPCKADIFKETYEEVK